jgi:hypothetical protein
MTPSHADVAVVGDAPCFAVFTAQEESETRIGTWFCTGFLASFRRQGRVAGVGQVTTTYLVTFLVRTSWLPASRSRDA